MALIKHGNNALSSVTAFPSAVPTGKPVLLSTATASASSSIEFTSGIDSTYDIYKWEFINIHAATDNTQLQFNLSTDTGSTYAVTKTSTHFFSYHSEDDASTALGYSTSFDLAQSTGNQIITNGIGNGNDESASGEMYLFSPSSDTFVKHFIVRTNTYYASNWSIESFTAGYGNTTSAVNAIKFVMSSGNIDAGQIKLYGIGAN